MAEIRMYQRISSFCHSRISNILGVFFILLLLRVLWNYAEYENFQKVTGAPTSKWWVYSDIEESDVDKSLQTSEGTNVSVTWKRFLKNKKKVIRDHSVRKLIVFDYPPFGEKLEYRINDEASCGRCEISYNTIRRPEADVVVFHLSGMLQHDLGNRSFPGQLYVWMNQESPWTTLRLYNITFDDYDDQFNLSMTYSTTNYVSYKLVIFRFNRRDSNILFPYLTFNQLVTQLSLDDKDPSDLEALLSRKRELVISVIGNCGATKGAIQRMRMMLSLLEAGLQVDVFGQCAHKPLEGGWTSLPEQVAEYKFFLSLENSFHCRDYITEKTWWNALRSGLVPVIWGPTRQDVEAVLPENSFLFVEDFDTPQALVDRLRYFDDHAGEYLKFFDWRVKLDDDQSQLAHQTEMTGFCQLCRMLHDDDQYEKEHGVKPTRMIPSIYDWWYKNENNLCLIPTSYSEAVSGSQQQRLLLRELNYGLLSRKWNYLIATVLLLIIICVHLFKRHMNRSSQ